MIHDIEDKMYRGEAERGRREARMREYRRLRGLDPPPLWSTVDLAAQPPCVVFRVDTSRTKPE